MRYLVSTMLVIISVIHLLPLAGVLGSEQLTALYGVPMSDVNLTILMRHRAVLFGMLGVFFLYAAFQREYQLIAFIAAFLSIGSFLWLTKSVGNYNAQLARVVRVDIVALLCNVIGVVAYLYLNKR